MRQAVRQLGGLTADLGKGKVGPVAYHATLPSPSQVAASCLSRPHSPCCKAAHVRTGVHVGLRCLPGGNLKLGSEKAPCLAHKLNWGTGSFQKMQTNQAQSLVMITLISKGPPLKFVGGLL